MKIKSTYQQHSLGVIQVSADAFFAIFNPPPLPDWAMTLYFRSVKSPQPPYQIIFFKLHVFVPFKKKKRCK